MKHYKIRLKKPWIAYSGSLIQQNYGEDLEHGYLLWDLKDKDNCNVKFRTIENDSPFYTISWYGNIDKFIIDCSHIKPTSRVRILSNKKISQSELVDINNFLKGKLNASEVIFKIDEIIQSTHIVGDDFLFLKNDLRNLDVQISLLKKFYKNENILPHEWAKISEYTNKYLNSCLVCDSICYKWSIKEIEFDNLYSYGEGNSINFEKLNGLVGILGPNRSGKSSIVGTILYSLFNSSDRGLTKNLSIINNKKNYCLSKAKINVKGYDYVIERQTTRQENKKGDQNGVTHLNLYKCEGDELIDLNGEQRNDTEKNIQSLIGSIDDFSLSSISTQGSLFKFIDEGSSQRKAVLSKFLDLDIFDNLHTFAKDDYAEIKTKVKLLASKNFDKEIKDFTRKKECLIEISSTLENEINYHDSIIENLTLSLAAYSNNSDENKFQAEYKLYSQKIKDLKENVDKIKLDLADKEEKLLKIASYRLKYNIEELKNTRDKINQIEKEISKVKPEFEKENLLLKNKEKSVLKLLDVPCGDQFSTCKYIKDSHSDKEEIPQIKDRIFELEGSLLRLKSTLNSIIDNEIDEKIKKFESVLQLEIALKEQIVLLKADNSTIQNNLEFYEEKFKEVNDKLSLNKDHTKEETYKQINTEIQEEKRLKKISYEKRMNILSEMGALDIQIKNLLEQKEQADIIFAESRIYEFLINAFSKKGIPHMIFSSQLPIINHELEKILTGITDFAVSIDCPKDSNSMEIFIDYGNGKRLIESCSGMEKTIVSIAIRSALSNVSVLPKCDFLILDEGFGTLDSIQVETSNRLLQSLKKYYKCIFIITHVDSMKEIMDQIIEIGRNGDESYVNVS